MNTISLDEIHGTFLTYTDYKIQRVALDNNQNLEQLWIQLAPASELTLQVFSAQDMLKSMGEEQSSEEQTSILYFFLILSVKVSPHKLGEIAKLLSFINQFIPLGSFELNQEEGIYYRYGLLMDDKWVDSSLILDIVHCVAQTIPPLANWIDKVLNSEEPNHDLLQNLTEEFRHLRRLMPRMGFHKLKQESKIPTKPFSSAIRWSVIYFLVGFISGVIGTMIMPFTNWITGLFLTFLILFPGFFITFRVQRYRERVVHFKGQKKQLDFYWHLLEVEQIKLAHQMRCLQTHRLNVGHKLQDLSQKDIVTPGDLVRLHHQMRQLSSFQEYLLERDEDLTLKEEELLQSQAFLKEERHQFFNEIGAIYPALLEDQHFQNPEDKSWPEDKTEEALFENLKETLEFLDFQVVYALKNHSEGELQVLLPAENKSLHIGYHKEWFKQETQGQEASSSWILYFYYPILEKFPAEFLDEAAFLCLHFNRYLPVGSLLLHHSETRLGLRYHFVRSTGDLSNFLIVEIMELIHFFGRRFETYFNKMLQGDNSREEILSAAEAEFLPLNNS